MAKTGWIIGGGVALFIGISLYSGYNGLVSADENVGQTYSQVQNQMQRQADLLPNLAETVKGYASHENDTFTQIASARSALTAVAKLDPRELSKDPELQKKLIEAQTEMSQTMVKLNSIKENYPELKAAPLFQNLMVSIEGSTNRVAEARRQNQLAVQTFNKSVRSLPTVIYAGAMGFSAKPYFEAADSAKVAPKLDLSYKKDK